MMGLGLPGIWDIVLIIAVLAGMILFVILLVKEFSYKAKAGGGKPRWRVDVKLGLAAAGIAVGSVLSSYYLSYLEGIKNSGPMSGVFICCAYPFGLIFLLGMIARLVVVGKNFGFEQAAGRLVLVLVVLSVVILSPKFHVGYMKPYMKGFREGMEDRADIEGIRKWLKTVKEPNGIFIYRGYEGLPEAIKTLQPKGVSTVELEDQEGFCVRLYWGGGFVHWGLVVGPEDMAIPETEINEYDKSGEYRERLADGAYIWYEV